MLFHTDYLSLICADVQAEKQWWIAVFDAKEVKDPGWDDPLPSDIALKLPGLDEPTILLRDRAQTGCVNPDTRPLLFCSNLKRAEEYFQKRQVTTSPIQEVGGKQYFTIVDPQGNAIEVCSE
ncbi:MAG: VOC family protein [Bryobacteraceae bacterium]